MEVSCRDALDQTTQSLSERGCLPGSGNCWSAVGLTGPIGYGSFGGLGFGGSYGGYPNAGGLGGYSPVQNVNSLPNPYDKNPREPAAVPPEKVDTDGSSKTTTPLAQ